MVEAVIHMGRIKPGGRVHQVVLLQGVVVPEGHDKGVLLGGGGGFEPGGKVHQVVLLQGVVVPEGHDRGVL